MYRNFYKAVTFCVVWFLAGFDVFLWAGGGEQKIVDIDPEGWHPVIKTILDWLNDPVKLVIVAVLVAFWIWNRYDRRRKR